ncbi:ATP-binding protein/SpoIIE family protein phosphatase [Streptomyces sp. NBC_01261]|uniref:ATP-binding SpoIIE family protein phosphatase n=1 Tax=Streptomyces sp. NBC_01261 TaxID=2903802 RepID=UPI002E337EA1|nr:ATP-binding SpoIIE family protein phosphatase [Streptomyces sp. NBC_01261]
MMTARSALLVDCEDVAWFRDGPDGARGTAAKLGRRIGLGEQRTAELVLAVAELAANLTKHATDGSLLLRILRNHAALAGDVVAGVEVITVDSGPGMADVPAALRDGMSTTSTLGIGLGAVERLADTFTIHSRPGTGTVQLARFWPHPVPPALSGEAAVGGITRPISGEQVCGDAWAARIDTGTSTGVGTAVARVEGTADAGPPLAAAPDWSMMTGGPRQQPAAARSGASAPVHAAVPGPGDGLLVMSCDGLGHGPLASLAAQAAVNAFRTGNGRTPEQAMEEVHRALRGTRGAAVAIARLESDGRVLFCGVGNITAALLTATSRANLLSHPGIAGHQMHRLRTHEYRLPAQGMLVMHSDGLSDRWSPADLTGLLHHPPAVIATALLRQAGTRRDDASAVIAKAAR